MKVKEKTKIVSEMIEFVIRCHDNKVWISIESMSPNKMVENAFRVELRKKEVNKICTDICEELDTIFDIEKNKNRLINIINFTNTEEKKLSLMKISMVSYSGLDTFGNEINFDPQAVIEVNKTQLPYLDVNNEFSRLVNYIHDNKQKLVGLASILYWAIRDSYYEYQNRIKSRN